MKLTLTVLCGIGRVLSFIGVGVLGALIVAGVASGRPVLGLIVGLLCAAPVAATLHWLESWLAHDMAYRLLAEMRARDGVIEKCADTLQPLVGDGMNVVDQGNDFSLSVGGLEELHDAAIVRRVDLTVLDNIKQFIFAGDALEVAVRRDLHDGAMIGLGNQQMSVGQQVDTAGPTTIAAGQSASFTVAFNPAIAGMGSGTLTFSSDATNSPTKALS